MSYKTIGVHVDRSPDAAVRIEVAARIAQREDAHLTGVAFTGISPYVLPFGAFDQGVPAVQLPVEELRAEGRHAIDAFERQVRAMGLSTVEGRCVEEEAGYGMALQARYCDLVVLGQHSKPAAPPLVPSNFTEYVLLHCTRPVLVVPPTASPDPLGRRILIGWNGSQSATRALTSAIALMQRAERVELLVLNPEQDGKLHGEQPGADIGLYLARHRIRVQVTAATTSDDIGSALLEHADASRADLIVMGAYGHSRLREVLLGGVTRSALHAARLPLWMAH